MTEEEKKRRLEELRGKRQAENRARNNAESRPKATDETPTKAAGARAKAAGRKSAAPATPDVNETPTKAAGARAKAAGAAAAKVQDTPTKETFGPPVPESLRHDAEMDRQFVDGFIKARVQGPQALEAWFRTLTKPQETAAPARARWADGQSGTQAREPDARTPPGFLAPQRPQTPDLPEDDGLSGAEEETLAQDTNDAALNETPATPDEAATGTNDAALDETPATPGEAATGTNGAAQTPVTPDEAATGTNDAPQVPVTPDETPAQEPTDAQDGQTADETQMTLEEMTLPDWYIPPEKEIADFKELVRGAAGEVIPSSVGAAVSMFKAGRGVYLTDEMMEEAASVLAENPELGDDVWKLGTGAHDGKEDEYAFLLGKEAKTLLTLLESPYLSDEQRGAGIDQYLRDKQAARDGGYYQLDGYYKDHPEALSAYDEIRQIDETGTAYDRLVAKTAQGEKTELLKQGFYTAIDHELDGILTDEDRTALVVLKNQDAFRDDDLFFQEQYGKTANLMTQNGVRNIRLLDEALRPLQREKQLAMALGMDLQTFWAENPDRAKTPEELAQNALDWYDSIYQKPLDYVVAGRTQNGYTAAVLDYLTARDEGRYGLSNLGVFGTDLSASDLVNIGEWILGQDKNILFDSKEAMIAFYGETLAKDHAADAALTATVAGLENAMVMAFGHSPEETVNLNRKHYEGLYGPWAPVMYKRDVLSIINEFYSGEEKEAALEKLGSVGDIFDLAIDTQPYLTMLSKMADRNEQKITDTILFIEKYGNEDEKAAFDKAFQKSAAFDSMLMGAFVSALTGSPVAGVAVSGVPAMGNKFNSFLVETEDWDSSKTAAFGGWLIRTGIALLPYPRNFNMGNKGQLAKGLQTVVQDGGLPAMRSLWIDLVELAKSPVIRDLAQVTGKAAFATGASETYEQFMRYGKIEDAAKILEDSMASGNIAGGVLVATWCAGSADAQIAALGKKLFGGKGFTQQNMVELYAGLQKLRENPQAVATQEAGLRQAFTDDWVGQNIAAGALNTKSVLAAASAAEAAQHDLETAVNVAQQKDLAVQAGMSALDAAVNRMLTSDGAEWEAAKQEVLNLSQELRKLKADCAKAQELVGPCQEAANVANRGLLDAQNIELDGLRAQAGKLFETISSGESAAAEGSGLPEMEAQDANVPVETENTKSENIFDGSGDLQETTDANSGIMGVDESENTFANPAKTDGGATAAPKDNNAPLTDLWRVDVLNENYSADYDGTSDVTEWANKTGELAKLAPIVVPDTAVAKVKQKQGYDQIAYTWRANGCRYLARWHSKTPGAPDGQVNTWVVSRIISGTPERQYQIHQILVGNKWISRKAWQDAIDGYNNNTATPEQLKLLEDGHWRAP